MANLRSLMGHRFNVWHAKQFKCIMDSVALTTPVRARQSRRDYLRPCVATNRLPTRRFSSIDRRITEAAPSPLPESFPKDSSDHAGTLGKPAQIAWRSCGHHQEQAKGSQAFGPAH